MVKYLALLKVKDAFDEGTLQFRYDLSYHLSPFFLFLSSQRLDYSGITFLIVGSFIPWLHFGFYCEDVTRYCYLVLIIVLGIVCLVVALRDTFSLPQYRPLRAG